MGNKSRKGPEAVRKARIRKEGMRAFLAREKRAPTEGTVERQALDKLTARESDLRHDSPRVKRKRDARKRRFERC